MCGIAGIVRWDGRPVEEDEIRTMCGAMVHRGPDHEGVWVDGGVALGMRRLSIIDLAGSVQPVFNEDRSVAIVFNGEIYNYRELRRDLLQRGHVFRTDGDTETIVHLYEDLGVHCVDRLRGMFAFAIWDIRRQRLLLARDRLGIKPLYYAEHDGELLFSSELKPILQLPHVQRDISWEAVGHLFTFLTTPSTQSIVDGVSKLEPAHVATATRDQRLRPERYWDVQFEPDRDVSEGLLVEQLRGLLEEAVELHQVSDVPVGAFLSGGVDSSAVVATMAGMVPDQVKTFSIGFAESQFNELDYARQMAKAIGTDHYDLVVRPDVVRIVEDLTWFLDEPFGDTSAIPTYVVSKLAAEHVKVVLSGDGGDEIFAGYERYLVEQQERRLDRVPSSLRRVAGAIGDSMQDGAKGRRFLRHLALTGPRRYLDAATFFRGDELQALLTPEAFEQVRRHDPLADAMSLIAGPQGSGLRPDRDWLGDIQRFDLHRYLPLDILTKVDRMTMAHSIEARPPLLDHKLVEFAASVPAKLRMRGGTTKYLFKQAMRDVLPDNIIDRPKHGFAVPLASWFRGELGPFAHDVLLSDTCRQRGVFQPAQVEHLLRMNAQGRDCDLQLWTLLSFELWCRRFMDAANRKGVSEASHKGSPNGVSPEPVSRTVREQTADPVARTLAVREQTADPVARTLAVREGV